MSALEGHLRPRPLRKEVVGTLALAWPIILGQVAQNLQFATNTLLMGWLGAADLAAGTLAMSLLHPTLLFAGGILSVVSPLVAQALGRGTEDAGRPAFQQGLWFCLIAALLSAPLFFDITPILLVLGQDPAISKLAGDYARIIGIVVLPSLGVVLFRNFLASHGMTYVALSVILLGCVLNLGLGCLLTLGVIGLPSLGLAGIGIATVSSNLVCLVILALYVRFHPKFARYAYYQGWYWPDLRMMVNLLTLGLPIGLFVLSEVGLFSGANFLMGSIDTHALAGYAISAQYIGLAFAIPTGIGVAAMVRVGWAFGAREPKGVSQAGWTAIGLCVASMACTSTLYLTIPTVLVGFFLDATNPANAEAFAAAVTFMAMVAMLQLSDGLQGLLSYVLRGMSDTFVPMLFGIIGYWPIGFLLSIYLGLFTDLAGIGVYIGIVVGVSVVALALLIRFVVKSRSLLVHGMS